LLRFQNLPLSLALLILLLGGALLLTKADAQARDTIRKHHLADIEEALYLSRSLHGTYPPYAEAIWCGRLNDPASAEVKTQIEDLLRQRLPLYANPAKPFPEDPLHVESGPGYFYWKRSPALFELYSVLEAAPSGDRATSRCPQDSTLIYDYGISSSTREQ
jgi:transglutaminase-like putative cysteine protease